MNHGNALQLHLVGGSSVFGAELLEGHHKKGLPPTVTMPQVNKGTEMKGTEAMQWRVAESKRGEV